MTDQTILAPQTSGAGLFFDRLVQFLNGIGTLWILAILILINADVFGRNVLHAPINGVIEMIEISMIAIVFLQLGDATRVGRLTRSDGFFGLIQRKWPKVGYVMGSFFDLLGALFMFFILYGTWPSLIEAWTLNDYIGNEGVFTAPKWPMIFILILGSFITLLLFVKLAATQIFAFTKGAPQR
ncbi:MAG: TRAP-type mannitol/chloroaromatic compound transport system permease small subunit [Paracoccaceae bacterium]|jgi:TRAP-type mannitol/chloroaromatic compound transport system permease small subunit